MPRSGWIAVGAAAAALVLADAPVGLRLAAIALTAAITILATVMTGTRRWAAIGVAAGAALVAIRLLAVPAPPVADAPPDGRGPWTMVVETVGAPREGDQVAMLRLEEPGSAAIFRVSATLPRYPPIIPGDHVVVEGRLRPRPDSPFGAYLERIRAWGTLDVDRLELAASDDTGRGLESLRRGAGDALARVLPEPEAGLAAGILIGLRDRVDRDVAAAFTTAGVSHVVAISGWNIAIVAAVIAAIAGRLGRRRRAIVTILAVVAYVAFAGASPSVLRAGAMAGVVLLARESGRAGRAPAALGWAAAGLLVVDPGLVADAGFQLSTLATAGLIAWGTGATERIDRWTGGRAPRWLAESLGVSMAAQLATLPIVVASFGRIALIAPVVNLAVVPLVAPVMAAGIVAMAGGVLVGLGGPAAVGAVFAVPAWVGMRLMIAIIDLAAGLPGASLTVEPPWDTALAAVVALGILTIVLRRRQPPSKRPRPGAVEPPRPSTNGGGRATRWAALGLIVAVACLGAIAWSRPVGVARLTVLDVGQGDAILLEGSRGGRLLVDGGPDPDRLLVELDRRLPPWDRRIDVVVISHPHEDHIAGLAMLLARYRIGQVVDSGMRGPGPGYAALATALANVGAPRHSTIAAGDRLRIDEVRVDVRWPIRGTVPQEPPEDGSEINNDSVVLLGTVGDRRFLLTGDIEEDVDPALVAGGLPPIDVLKVAHHGSRTASTADLLSVVRPKVAITSLGTGNRYGHPAPETLDRLTAVGSALFRTDLDGAVSVTFTPEGPIIRTTTSRSGRTTTGDAPDHSSRWLVDVPNHPQRRRFEAGLPPSAGSTSRRGLIGSSRRADDAGRWPGPGRGSPRCVPCVHPGLGRYHRLDARPPPDRLMVAPLLYLWGDDDLLAERLVKRFATALAAELGNELERWDARPDQQTATAVSMQLAERLATPVLFGGGTLAVVANPGALTRRNDTRDRVVEAISLLAAGNAIVFVETSQSNAKGPGPKKLAEAVTQAGGKVVSAMAPRPTALGAWIETEARERGLQLGPGAARELAERLGSRVTEGDVDRRYVSRVASMELDKLALRHAVDGGQVSADDVRELVAETTPTSVWALTDAVAERKHGPALEALDRLVDDTPEPVLLAVLHRRVVELLELRDRMANGDGLPVAARAMGINSEFRARTLAGQARHWTIDELGAALAGLVELDSMVKNVPGSAADAAQRRLAFTLWVDAHTAGG